MNTFHSIKEAITFLRDNMKASDVSSSFPNAALFLGGSKDERALAPLLEALRHGSPYIRATAASGLGYLGRSGAVPELIEAFLKDPALYVRCDAALALGRLGAEDSLRHFIRRFPKEHFEVQKRILTAISNIGTAKARRALEAIEEMIGNSDMSDSSKKTLRSLAQQEPKVVA